MRWKEESSRYFSDFFDGDEILLAMDIINEAYDDGFINWYIYREAKDRIKANLEGGWMFENETKYITQNMGEITVKHDGIFTQICGNYNSKEIIIASTGLVSFEENFDYIMNVVNQYSKIHEISKKAIIDNFSNNENIRDFFYKYYSLEEEEFIKLLSFTTPDEDNIRRLIFRFHYDKEGKEKMFELFFNVNKTVEKLDYPCLYFDYNYD
jgi:hypothetical protein